MRKMLHIQDNEPRVCSPTSLTTKVILHLMLCSRLFMDSRQTDLHMVPSDNTARVWVQPQQSGVVEGQHRDLCDWSDWELTGTRSWGLFLALLRNRPVRRGGFDERLAPW